MFRRDPVKRTERLIDVLRQQHEINDARDIGLINMPKHKATMDQLARMGSDAVPVLLQTLTAPRHDSKTAQGQLDTGIANDVAEVLGSIGDPRAVGPLMEARKQHIIGAGHALGEFREGAEALIAGLDDSDDHVRVICLEGLAFASIDRPRKLDAVKRGIRDPSAWVRRTAANTALISQVGDEELIAALSQAMQQDPDETVQRMAEKAHSRLKAA